MATKYTINFTDVSKPSFDLQAYTTNGPVSPSDPSLMVGSTAAATTLQLYGKGRNNYGEDVFQNMVYMLENFANSTPPVLALEGQAWYKKGTSELLIRNANPDDSYSGSPTFAAPGWDAAILASGSSVMKADLILSGTGVPASPSAAVPLQYVIDEITSVSLPAEQYTFLDGLDFAGGPLLTSAEVNYLSGVTSNVQTQIDNKVSRIANTTMDAAVNLIFDTGEVLGLPTVPSADGAAASKRFVLDQFAAVETGDGVLTSTQWVTPGLGSPILNPTETTLRLVVTLPTTGSPPAETIIDVQGVSRVGHTHTALDTSINNSFDLTYGIDVQAAIERAATDIDLLITGGIPPSATITVQRSFEDLATPIIGTGSPLDSFKVQDHFANDNRVSLSVNGVKQYAHTHASQIILYDQVTDAQLTGLNPTQAYDFDITVDGIGPTTITINAGSPFSSVTTHAELVTAINSQLIGLGVVFSIESFTTEVFKTTSSGTGSTILISDPASANIYLFDAGSPTPLTEFVEVSTPVAGIEGDYTETDVGGVPVLPGLPSSYVVFNYDIITGSKIESLLYV